MILAENMPEVETNAAAVVGEARPDYQAEYAAWGIEGCSAGQLVSKYAREARYLHTIDTETHEQRDELTRRSISMSRVVDEHRQDPVFCSLDRRLGHIQDNCFEDTLGRYQALFGSLLLRFSAKCEDKAGMRSVALDGFRHAYVNFDLAAANSFKAYAYSTMQGRIRNFIRDDWLAGTRSTTRYERQKLIDAKNLEVELSEEEVAEFLGMSVTDLQDLHAAEPKTMITSLDTSLRGEEDLIERLAGSSDTEDEALDLSFVLAEIWNRKPPKVPKRDRPILDLLPYVLGVVKDEAGHYHSVPVVAECRLSSLEIGKRLGRHRTTVPRAARLLAQVVANTLQEDTL